MTADAAVRGIRRQDADGSIAMFCAEPHPPYDRPPLSKALWKDQPFESIWRHEDGHAVDVLTGRKVLAIDAELKTVRDDAGEVCGWDKLLLATGGSVRRLPQSDEGVIYFRTADDYLKLRALCEKGDEFVVIGGGFIGSEIAAALAINGKRVSMIFPLSGICARAFPPGLATFLNDYYRSRGVSVLDSSSVRSVRSVAGKAVVTLEDNREISAAGVIAGLGIKPDTVLAEQAGLAVDNGIVVDTQLRTSHPDIYAAGDVANFYSTALAQRMRVEHEDCANTMGEMAGGNMAGQAQAYTHQPFFYSDLFDLGYEAVGKIDAGLDIVEDWQEPYRKGVVYYLDDGRVCGVLLWNTWGQVEVATRLIASGDSHTRETLHGLITD